MDDKTLNELVEELSHGDGMVRDRARIALVMEGSKAVPLLVGLLDSSHKHTRWEAARTLAAIADPSTIDTLVGLLSDRDFDLRWIASMGLIKIGVPSAPAVLDKLISAPDSTDLRRAVHHILYDLARNHRSIAEDIEPVTEALGESAPAETVIWRAQQALKKIESLEPRTTSDW